MPLVASLQKPFWPELWIVIGKPGKSIRKVLEIVGKFI